MDCRKYCQAGQTLCIRSEELDGFYWYYETDHFIIDIHDFFIKKERMTYSFPDLSDYMSYCSAYIKSANGESFNPYQILTANTVFVTNIKASENRFLLHANFPYLSVGINFKEQMIKAYISRHFSDEPATVSDMFFDTRGLITKPMEKLASSILNCGMSAPAAELFFEAKAKEWLSITMDAFLNKSKEKEISYSDEVAITNVENYIKDHFAMDIPQEILEKIAMMSGTKLKSIFKQKYQMSITEYTQRRRMNIAEILLGTTALEINAVAKSVGYSSHSRFTTLFKKYKGIYPREVKKLGSVQNFL